MTMWWILNAILYFALFPTVVFLLWWVLKAAKNTRAAVDALVPVAKAASKDLDSAALLVTTKSQVNTTIGVVADYGGSLDTILEDA
jgi:hypothetical protein